MTSAVLLLNLRVNKLTGFGSVLKETKSHLVFSHKTKSKQATTFFRTRDTPLIKSSWYLTLNLVMKFQKEREKMRR